MKEEVKVSFYLKKNEGVMCPVMVRLSVGKSQTVFSAKLKVKAEIWAVGRAKGKSKEAGAVNQQLDELRALALASHKELSATRVRVTADEVKSRMLGMASGQETLLAYFQAHNEKFEQRVGVNRSAATAVSYKFAYKHAERFVHEVLHLKDIPFSALDRSFIEKYDHHLRTECSLSQGTIVIQEMKLCTVINYAIADGIITHDPFAGYKKKCPAPRQRYLPREDLDKLMTTNISNPRHQLVRDMFVFACYTGICYSDMCRLTERDLWVAPDGTTWIKARRKKTNVEFQVPLLDIPLQILENYRDLAPSGRLLPMLSNGSMNLMIKGIARKCGIARPVSWHVARHTYASVITLSQGIPLETVSKMLGHREIKMTERYAIVTNDKIADDLRGLDEKLSQQFKFAI